MIHFVLPEESWWGIESYLGSPFGSAAAALLHPNSFERLFQQTLLKQGTWVWSGMDRLSPVGLNLLLHLHQRLSAAGQPILNHPTRSMQRQELLQAAYDAGINRFRSVRADEYRGGLRFPVFIREASKHEGNLTVLLHSDKEVRDALAKARLKRLPYHDLLVVEFCDVSENGFYRKYAAFRVGDAILPKNLQISRDWMVKSGNSVKDPAAAEENNTYNRDNPHREQIRRLFDLARIDYGRIDYGILGGEIQVWEINTCPTIWLGRTSLENPHRPRFGDLVRTSRDSFFAGFQKAWEAVDSAGAGEIPAAVPPEVLAAWRREAKGQKRARARIAAISRLAANPMVSAIRPALQPFLTRFISRLFR